MSEAEETIIKLDFGAGNVVPLHSRCLRVAKKPTDCDICEQTCPVQAITLKDIVVEPGPSEGAGSASEASAVSAPGANTDAASGIGADADPETIGLSTPVMSADSGESADSGASTSSAPVTSAVSAPATNVSKGRKIGIEVSEHCIHCGLCTTTCPVEALTATQHHAKAFEKQIKDRVAQAEGVALGCARALYGVTPRLAQKAISLPCLAALSAEEWFYAAALARDALFPALSSDAANAESEGIVGDLKVYLPSLICDNCPVNICGEAENTYLAQIQTAEAWGAENIELIDDAHDLSGTSSGTLMTALGDVEVNDKREMVEQLAAGLRSSWQNAADDLNREKNKAALIAEQRKQSRRKTQTYDPGIPRPFGKKSQRRRLLHDALEQKEALAQGLELVSAGTEMELCTGCGECVGACPLGARRLISSSSVLYFGKLPEEKRPKEKQAAVTDQLCCLGCSACVQACPIGASTLTWLSGEDFLHLRLT